MMTILSLSSEVTLLILQECEDFSILRAAISSCKRLHSVWLSNPGPLIWNIGRRSIVTFDDALMAVRATNIVRNAVESDQHTPVPFPVAELSGTHRLPSIQELCGVLDLQHMMRCIQHMILYWELHPSTEFYYDPGLVGWEVTSSINDTKNDTWRKNLYRALYRNVLLGAICYGAYNEPLISTIEAKDFVQVENLSTVGRWLGPSVEMCDFLKRFPLYDFDAEEGTKRGDDREHEHQKVFGVFSDWILNDIRKNESYPGQSPNFLAAIAHLVSAYEHLCNKIVNEDPSRNLARPDMSNIGIWRRDFGGNAIVPPPPNEFPAATRKTVVILFGNFQLEEIEMPASVADMSKRLLTASPYKRRKGINPYSQGIKPHQEVRALTDGTASEIPYWDIPAFLPFSQPPEVPPLLAFFNFILKREGWRFSGPAFGNMPGREDFYQGPFYLLANPLVFCHGGCGLGLFREYGQAPSSGSDSDSD